MARSCALGVSYVAMLILGVTDGERPAAALVRSARLVVAHRAVETFSGPGYPWSVADTVLATGGVGLTDVGRVVFGSHVAPPRRLDGLGRVHPSLVPAPTTERLLRQGARWMRDVALEETGLWTVASSVRRRRQTARLREAGFVGDVKTLDHYRSLSHAAWRCQGRERILVMVASSDGDGTTLAVHVGDHDGLRLLYRQGGLSSLRTHVAVAADDAQPSRAAATLAERAADSEAPEELEERFARLLRFSAGGFNLALRTRNRVFADVLQRHTPGEVAAACQHNLERQFRRWVHHWVRRSGIPRLAVAGDVFASPGLCRALLTQDDVDELFVLPAPVAQATAIGAAMRYADAGPATLDTPYLGPTPEAKACADALEAARLDGRPTDRGAEEAAALLAGGGVMAWVAGPSALGVRSLGHRSLLARADAPDAVQRLGSCPTAAARASRTLILSASLAGSALRRWDAVTEASRLGAVPLRPTHWLRSRCPTLTGEPVLAQVVSPGDSPALDGILSGLEAGGALPVLMGADLLDGDGEEPDTPEAALLAFLDADADALQLGPYRVDRAR